MSTYQFFINWSLWCLIVWDSHQHSTTTGLQALCYTILTLAGRKEKFVVLIYDRFYLKQLQLVKNAITGLQCWHSNSWYITTALFYQKKDAGSFLTILLSLEKPTATHPSVLPWSSKRMVVSPAAGSVHVIRRSQASPTQSGWAGSRIHPLVLPHVLVSMLAP